MLLFHFDDDDDEDTAIVSQSIDIYQNDNIIMINPRLTSAPLVTNDDDDSYSIRLHRVISLGPAAVTPVCRQFNRDPTKNNSDDGV